MSEITRGIKEVLFENYMPYAKSSIVNRAIPFIDGLKPVNRRTLYCMYTLGLDKKEAKCAKIIGETMKLHPHGDSSIYDALTRLTDSSNYLNLPYINGESSFGDVTSTSKAAAYRYTEASLLESTIKLMFDGIKENAVDLIDNFDGTEKEPRLLPVKYPNILVNGVSGVAVGMATDIPSYNLKAVCETTALLAEGKAKTAEDIVDVLGSPDYPTGGSIHMSRGDKLKLLKTGKAQATMLGGGKLGPGKIVINEFPYGSTIEAITASVKDKIKSGELKEITDILDVTSVEGNSVEINLKKNADPRRVLAKLYRMTPLRKKMNYNIRVAYTDRCPEMGVLELLEEWIKFRLETIERIYTYRKDKNESIEATISAWEKIGDSIEIVATEIAKRKEADAKTYLMEKFNCTEIQADYLLDMKIKHITTDRVAKILNDLVKVREELKGIYDVLGNEAKRRKIIASELREIAEKYGTPRKTTEGDALTGDEFEEEDAVVEDANVIVLVTKNGYIKRVMTVFDMEKVVESDDDEIIQEINCNNLDSILVYYTSGVCCKIPVHTIDNSRGKFRDYINMLVDNRENAEILHVASSGNTNGFFNIVYSNGKGVKVWHNKVSGNRKRYKSLYAEGTLKNMFATTEDKFFIVTYGRSAAYADLTYMTAMGRGRTAFKVARVGSNDAVGGVQALKYVPIPELIDFERYSKGYTVKIKDDVLW